ncbi:Multidrug resistance protein MdtH, partial [termite gut metagenome]
VYQRMSDKVAIAERFVNEKGLQIADGLSTNAYFEEVARQTDRTPQELTNLLWNTYDPSRLWIVILSIGVVATIGLLIYDKVTSNKH